MTYSSPVAQSRDNASRTHHVVYTPHDTFERPDEHRSTIEVVRTWLSLVTGLLVTAMCGSAYAIATWNIELKHEMRYTQAEIGLVAALGNFGLFMALPPGWLYDTLGPRLALLICSFGVSMGYTALNWGVSGQWDALAMGVILCLVGQAAVAGLISVVGVNEGNFGPTNTGTVYGVLFSGVGVGCAVFGPVFQTFYADDVRAYFLLLAVIHGSVALLGSLFAFTNRQGRKTKLMSEKVHRLDSVSDSSEGQTLLDSDYDGGPESRYLPSSCSTSPLTRLEREQERHHEDRVAVYDPCFWFIMLSVMVSVGVVLLFVNNVSFIVQSLGGEPEMVSMLVVLFAIANVASRLGFGFLSDLLSHKIRRPFFLLAANMIAVMSQVSLFVFPLDGLYVSAVLCGLAEGGMFATYPLLIRELFGAKKFGTNYGLVSIGNAVGFPLIVGPIATALYHSFSTFDSSGIEICIGRDCYSYTFALTTGLTVATIGSALRLIQRTDPGCDSDKKTGLAVGTEKGSLKDFSYCRKTSADFGKDESYAL